MADFELDNEENKEANKELDRKIKKVDNVMSLVAAILATVVAVGLLISTFTMYTKYEEQEKENEKLRIQIVQQDNRIFKQAEEIAEMKDAIQEMTRFTYGSGNEQGSLPGTTDRDSSMYEHRSEVEENRGNDGLGEGESDPKEPDLNQADMGRVYLKSYVVKEGDTLESICEKEGIDYGTNYRIILAMNGIKEDVTDMVGQQIILPVLK